MEFDRVLGGDHHERLRQGVGLVVDAHAPFAHGFEQGALGLGGRTVDFVREHYVGEQRPPAEDEVALLPVEDRDAYDVRGEQVARELDPAEGAFHRPGERMCQSGFPNPGDVLDEEVPLGQETDEGEPDGIRLAAHDGLDRGLQPAGQVLGFPGFCHAAQYTIDRAAPGKNKKGAGCLRPP